VRTTHFLATSVAIVLVALTSTQVLAQQAAAPRGAAPGAGAAPGGSAAPNVQHGIAVIDITYILDHYARLKQATEAFKRDMENAETSLKKERESMAKKAEELKTKKPGTPDFKALEESLIKMESDWKLKVNRQKSEFAEREAKNYLTAYREISEQVKLYADRNNISLVLRFNGAPVDPNNREAVQAEVFKMVMYHHRDIDITDQVLGELNRNAAVASPPRSGQPQRPVSR